MNTWRWIIFIVFLGIGSFQGNAGERIVFGDDKLSFVLPDGWKKSERNADTTLIGWESPDATTSLFIQKLVVGLNTSMEDMMEGTVSKFDGNDGMVFEKIGKYQSGQVKGPGDKKFPAIYTTLEATLKAKPKDFPMKFYLYIFDTGSNQYFIQASTTKPIWDVREKQIMSVFQTLIARP